MSEWDQVIQAKTISKGMLLSRPNVIGVGVGYRESRKSCSDELSVVVLVRRKLPRAALKDTDLVPQEVGGVRTDVIEVGDIRPLTHLLVQVNNGTNRHTSRFRPAPGGVSIGHYQVTAGTLGCIVHDRASGERLILSNNHVLADCNQAQAGDPILQPGPADSGEMGRDTLGYLERFVPIRYASEPATCDVAQAYARIGNMLAHWAGARHRLQAFQANPTALNRVDAAVARPIQATEVLEEIYAIGPVNGITPAALGMSVVKSGRTTGYTAGTITVLDATINVNYGLDRSARFEGQVVTSPMSQGGDSGSLVIKSDGRQAVGLLFSGSAQATICNPIGQVLDRLKVTFTQKASKAPATADAVLKAQAVRAAWESTLLAKPNVVGVGIGLRHIGGRRTDQIGLVVMVDRKLPEALIAPQDRIPSEIDGVPVDVRPVGRLQADS